MHYVLHWVGGFTPYDINGHEVTTQSCNGNDNSMYQVPNFNYHPILMSYGIVVVFSEGEIADRPALFLSVFWTGVIAWRASPAGMMERRKRKIAHGTHAVHANADLLAGVLMAVSLVLVISAISVVLNLYEYVVLY